MLKLHYNLPVCIWPFCTSILDEKRLNAFFISHSSYVPVLQWSFFIVLGVNADQLNHRSTNGIAERGFVIQTWTDYVLFRERWKENAISTSFFFSEGLWTGERQGSPFVSCASKKESRQGVKYIISTSMITQELLAWIVTYWEGFSYMLCHIILPCLPSTHLSFLPQPISFHSLPSCSSPQPLCLPTVSIPVSFNKLPFPIHSVTTEHNL